MATLPTYGFNVRALPRLAEIDPRDFRGGIPDFQQGFQGSLASIEGLLRNVVLEEQKKAAQRRGVLEEIEQPSKIKTTKERAEGEARRAPMEEGVKDIQLEDTMIELPEVREQRQAKRAADTEGAVADRQKAQREQRVLAATDTEAERQVRAAQAAEIARNEAATRNAPLKADAEAEALKTQGREAWLARLPRKQRVTTDAQGAQTTETFVTDSSGNDILIESTNPRDAETVRRSRELLDAQIAATKALETQRKGVGRVRTFQTKMGDPLLGQQVTLTTSVDGAGNIISQTATDQKGKSTVIEVPDIPSSDTGPAAPPVTAPSAAPKGPPAGAPKPSQAHIQYIREASTTPEGAAAAKQIFDSKFGWAGAYDYYMVNDE